MFYIAQNGQKSGPHETHDVIQYIRQSRFKGEDLGWREGMAEWLPLRQLFPAEFLAARATHPVQLAGATPVPGGPGPTVPPNSAALKHSGLGVASFVISTLSGVLMFAILIIAGVMEESTPGGMDEESPAVLAVGFSVLALIGFSALALLLGFIGLFQGNRKKIFAVLGTLFSAMMVGGIILIIALGLAMQ